MLAAKPAGGTGGFAMLEGGVSAEDLAVEVPSSEVNNSPRLVIEGASSFNYAAWQNSVPLLSRITIDNAGGQELSSLELACVASPAFAREKRWTIDRVNADATLALRDTELEIDPAYLDSLDEAERGVLTFTLRRKGNVLAEATFPLRVLARDEWGGMGTMGELLPAFVTPNDPALAPLLRTAADALGQHGHSTALDGYQSQDPNRAYMLAAALWSAVAGQGLVYANPPSSFEQVGQKARRVATVLGDGLATCLDTTLLFASAIEAVGLNPVIVMTEGHCFAGAWLVEKTFRRLVEQDCLEPRKAIAARELIVFETTLVTHQPPAQFVDAVAVASRAISQEKEHEFVAVIDVARGRMSQVRPLASHSERTEQPRESTDTGPLPLPKAPGFDATPASLAEERPTTPAGRIERWQRKLLDLSMRNRLLNFRSSKQTVPVLCPDVSHLEDMLANGTKMRMMSLADGNPLAQRDAELHHKRTQKDLDLEFARKALDRGEVVCPIDQRELDVRLTALFRKVKNDLAEGGTNTLYLAVGFLRWKQSAREEKTFRAPLLLVPVQLIRRSASSPYYLTSHEDEVRFNATLLQMLKKDFDCDLTYLESDLPMDDSGVDVPLVFERMRHAVRDIAGFEVVEEAAIAPFSFAKYLMWKDLVERVGQLEHNRVVRHLIHDPDKAFESAGTAPMPQPHELDKRYRPDEIVHPLPADSSQLAAVMAAAEGHDLVIVGPPGTGKSQTIANMIAQCLAVGKTVLFVAEKTAALDVVHRRLREHGLGDCCVELHSNKAERRRFLDQLENSWQKRGKADASEWVEINEKLRVRRDQLNAYAAALHTPEANGWTAYRAMGESVRGRDLKAPPLTWPRNTRHDRTLYSELETNVALLATTFAAVKADPALERVQIARWSMSWETDLLAACQQLEVAAKTLGDSLRQLSDLLELPELADVSAKQLAQVYRLAQEMNRPQLPVADLLQNQDIETLAAALEERGRLVERSTRANESLRLAISSFYRALGGTDTGPFSEEQKKPLYHLANELIRPELAAAELVFHPHFEQLKQLLADRPAIVEARRQAFAAIEARGFSAALVDRIDVDNLESEWRRASSAFWPASIWKKSGVRKKAKAYMGPQSEFAPDIDLPLLREYQQACERLEQNTASIGLSNRSMTLVENDPNALAKHLEAAARLRDVLTATGVPIETIRQAVNSALEPLVHSAKGLYPPGRDVELARKQLKDNLAALELSQELKAAVDKAPDCLSAQINATRSLRATLDALGVPHPSRTQALTRLTALDANDRRHLAQECGRSAKAFQAGWGAYTEAAGAPPVGLDSPSVVADAATQAVAIGSHRTQLKRWTAWVAVKGQSQVLGLGSFVDAMQTGELSPRDAVDRFRLAYARWWLPTIVDLREPLRTFQRFLHEEAINEFCMLDDRARAAAAPRTRNAVLHGLPTSDKVPKKSELGLLRHQTGLKRPSKSIREMISGMPETFGKLAPCLLMSPLSIAQYLPADQTQFDVVIFDEASQIATWDAIGAIARGKQTIIVGDPKQLPPTNFFGKAESDEDNDELEDHEKDLESILDEAASSGLETLQLNWHYRSKHESLIAFSNWNYYGNRLVTFPAAESEDRGVSLRHIAGALYDRGKSRTNRQEAEAIVAEAVTRMRKCLAKPPKQRLTYGVVTFNSQQQSLIQDLFDEAQRQHPELDWFFSDDRIEPTAVKNLENVQGDERDVMMFSITFGFDAAGKFPVDFGAINRDGGERRLNVAVTRARQELVVFSSFLPDQLRADRSNARGIHDLKSFLEYAHKGPEAMAARIDGSLGEAESPLELAIATAVESRGWEVVTQVGVSGFRIDLGVMHPDKPGAYLAGIECDGATYHRSAVARDRDKIRQQVLENLGWNILRVWSTDWWYDADAAIDELDAKLKSLYEASQDQPEPTTVDKPVDVLEFESESSSDLHADELAARTPLVARHETEQPRLQYQRAELRDHSANQSRFFDDDYSDALREMSLAIIESQGPIRDDVLAREIARAHGFARTGNKMKERVLELVPNVAKSEELVGNFLWPNSEAKEWIPFRYAADDLSRRSIEEIAIPELIGLVKKHPLLATADDPALALARVMGLARLARSARDRLEIAIEASTGEN